MRWEGVCKGIICPAIVLRELALEKIVGGKSYMTDEQLRQYAKITLSLKKIEDTEENISNCIEALK